MLTGSSSGNSGTAFGKTAPKSRSKLNHNANYMEYQDALINEDQNGLIDDRLAEDVKLRLEAGLTQTGETDEGNLEWIGTRDMWNKYHNLATI